MASCVAVFGQPEIPGPVQPFYPLSRLTQSLTLALGPSTHPCTHDAFHTPLEGSREVETGSGGGHGGKKVTFFAFRIELVPL